MRKQFHMLLREKKSWKFNSTHGSGCQGLCLVRNSDLCKIHMVGVKRVLLPNAIFVPNNTKWAFPLQILFLFLQTLLSHRIYPNPFNPVFIMLFSLAVGTFCWPPLSVSVCLQEIQSKPLLCPAPCDFHVHHLLFREFSGYYFPPDAR